MKRKVIVFLTVLAVLVCVALPCFAAEIDFNYYITNSSISGDDTIVDVSIPIDVFHSIQWRLWNRTNGTWPLLTESFGKSFTYTYSQSLEYALTVAPFGTDVLDVRDIPDGTILTFSYTVHGVAYSGESGLPARIGMSYYDANGKSLGFVNGAFQTGQFLEDNAVSFTLDKPVGCVSVKPALTFDSFNPIGNNTYTLTLESVSFRFSIDSLLKLQQETGRTNKILTQIMNGEVPDVTIPGDQSGELDQITDDVVQQQLEIIEYFQNLIDNFSDTLDGLGESISVFNTLLNVVLNIPFISFLLTASIVLGSVGAFLGIINFAFHRKE